MQQATVNLLSDMGAPARHPPGGLVAGGAVDGTAPTAAITVTRRGRHPPR